MRKLADYTAEQLVFVDESAANEHTSHRKYGWAPVGVTPHEYRRFERSKRWSVLPAYTVDGFITWEIEHGSFSQELCDDVGVLLDFLPPYSPDFNPIEEAFAELKAWMRKNNQLQDAYANFEGFL